MTVWELMKKIGKYEKFHIQEGAVDVTKGEPTSVEEIECFWDDRESVFDALEYEAVSVDLERNVIYCRR